MRKKGPESPFRFDRIVVVNQRPTTKRNAYNRS